MKTVADIKAQYEGQEVGHMTTDEVYAYAKELEALAGDLEAKLRIETVAYGISRDEIRFILSGMLNLSEDYISEDLIDTAFGEIKRNFTMEEETEVFANFLRGQLDIEHTNHVYSGILSPDGSVLNLYFHDEPGMDTPDSTLTGDAVEDFLEKVFGEDFDVKVDTSPFTFDRSALSE